MSSDQMPAPGKIKLIKFPPPGQEKTSNARGMSGGGDVEASIWLIHKWGCEILSDHSFSTNQNFSIENQISFLYRQLVVAQKCNQFLRLIQKLVHVHLYINKMGVSKKT